MFGIERIRRISLAFGVYRELSNGKFNQYSGNAICE